MIVKGSSITIEGTAYTDQSQTTKANLTSATITFICKRRADDADGAALFTKTLGSGVTITDAANGAYTVVISASDTNSLTFKFIYYETVIKLSSGAYIRNGVNELPLYANLKVSLP